MKINISGKGIYRREVPGIEKLRALPAHWYAFTNLELVDAGSIPKQIDVILVFEDRILIVDLKDWAGKITSDGDRWFQNDRAVDTSPVKKILVEGRSVSFPVSFETPEMAPKFALHTSSHSHVAKCVGWPSSLAIPTRQNGQIS
jgi:hypothetical protein